MLLLGWKWDLSFITSCCDNVVGARAVARQRTGGGDDERVSQTNNRKLSALGSDRWRTRLLGVPVGRACDTFDVIKLVHTC